MAIQRLITALNTKRNDCYCSALGGKSASLCPPKPKAKGHRGKGAKGL